MSREELMLLDRSELLAMVKKEVREGSKDLSGFSTPKKKAEEKELVYS